MCVTIQEALFNFIIGCEYRSCLTYDCNRRNAVHDLQSEVWVFQDHVFFIGLRFQFTGKGFWVRYGAPQTATLGRKC